MVTYGDVSDVIFDIALRIHMCVLIKKMVCFRVYSICMPFKTHFARIMWWIINKKL